ncbi:MAG: efflux RND transporter periplasmic adaptor subunit [Proteobacteria bacterium]|nr:efflux RND transporter periplasmic adaptor subunit [Pseudomonadota bacterium]
MFSRFAEQLDRAYRAVMPGFWLNMSARFQWACGIAAIVVIWIASGFLTGTGAKPVDESDTSSASQVTKVQVAMLAAQDRAATITVRGRTQALHSVDVRAEVEGVVQTLHFEKGDMVKKGDVLCEIKMNDRGARLEQARAMVAQTAKQHEVNLTLAKDGFRSKTQVAQTEAALEAAKASERTMEIQVDNTRMRAPFDAFVDDRYVDVGDYMRPGDKCALLIAPEPFLAIGMVTEREVGQIAIGDPATAKLVTGETVAGKVRFVASRADTSTRAFRVEVELPNADNKLRDGVSADILVPVKHVRAAKISPGILVLADNGAVGVRTVEGGIVKFHTVRIISDGPDGMWVAGLPENVAVITVGQEFVNDGEKVQAVTAKKVAS